MPARGGTARLAALAVAAVSVLVPLASGVAPTPAGATITSSWATSALPLPPTPAAGTSETGQLDAAACASATLCVAVGTYGHGTVHHALLETWSTGAWHASTGGTSSSYDAVLNAVSCPSATDCVAVGSDRLTDTPTTITITALVETWSTGAWARTTFRRYTPPTSFTTLRSVTCPAVGRCAATGTGSTGSAGPMLATLSTGSWTTTTAIGPENFPYEDAITCSSPASCVAVGLAGATGTSVPLVSSLAGTSWTFAAPPLPSTAAATPRGTDNLRDVGCAGGTCVAVGTYQNLSGGKGGLIETRVGTGSWQATAAPVPAGATTPAHADTSLGAVSCTGAGACTAFGTYVDAAGHRHGLIETLAATSWSPSTAPEPETAGTGTSQSARLASGRCSAAGVCTAFGTYEDAGGHMQFLLEVLDTGTWSAAAGQLPATGTAAAAGTDGQSLGCAPGGTTCVAVGHEVDGAGLDQPLASTLTPAPPAPHSYWEVAADGGIFAFGDAGFYGSMGGKALNAPIVGLAKTPDGKGYWEVAADGGIFAFGDAQFYGSMGGTPLNRPVVGVAATPDGKGYWEVAADGGIFAFGDAGFYGSMGGKPLDAPIVGMAATPDGKGYWEVAADGGIFAFGDAGFYGSMGGRPLDQPVVGMSSTHDGKGYWEVTADGGIFAFGDAGFYGSLGGKPLAAPVVGIAAVAAGVGYWVAQSAGWIENFGSAGYGGSEGDQVLNAPIVGMAAVTG